MPGIAIVQASSRQVEHADKEGHEHVGLIHACHCLVHSDNNTVGHRLMGRNGAEYGSGDRHEE